MQSLLHAIVVCSLYRSRLCKHYKCDPVCGRRRITVEGVLEEGKTVDSHCDWLPTIFTQAVSECFLCEELPI